MNKDIIMYLERKMGGTHSRRRGGSGDYRNRDDYGYDFEDSRSDYRSDNRESSHRARAPRGEAYHEDYAGSRDYEDGNDYHQYKHIKLAKSDFSKWERMLHNTDGTHGPHYNLEQAIMIAEKLGIRFDSYTEREFCMCLNMMYADYGSVIAKHVPPEKVLHVLAEMAKAFFDDPDGPEPSEKLALYFHCVACSEE
jgi:hypothetical protein